MQIKIKMKRKEIEILLDPEIRQRIFNLGILKEIKLTTEEGFTVIFKEE